MRRLIEIATERRVTIVMLMVAIVLLGEDFGDDFLYFQF